MSCVAVLQGPKTYILSSTIYPVLIERAAVTNKRIVEVETANAPDDVDDAEPGARTYSSLIVWNSSDQLAALGDSLCYPRGHPRQWQGHQRQCVTSRPVPSSYNCRRASG